MSKTFVVFGATGQQGGSAVDFVLNDSKLSKEFKVRALTRDPSSASSQALKQKGAEVVKCDIDDEASIKKAVEDAHTVFAVTLSIYDREKARHEVIQAKAIVDAAVAEGAQLLIWSSQVSVIKSSNGILKNCTLFDIKAEIEEYIRTLPIKSVFFAPASFMQNVFRSNAPRPNGDDTYAVTNIWPKDAQIPLIEVSADTGKWIGAILSNRDAYSGKFFAAATKCYTPEEMVQIMSKASGKTITYQQVPQEVFQSFLPKNMDKEVVDMNRFFGEYGYYGEDTVGKVEWTAKQAIGKLTTFEEFLERNPLKLE